MGAVRTQSERSEPGEAQQARLDCNSHTTRKNLHIRHENVYTYNIKRPHVTQNTTCTENVRHRALRVGRDRTPNFAFRLLLSNFHILLYL